MLTKMLQFQSKIRKNRWRLSLGRRGAYYKNVRIPPTN